MKRRRKSDKDSHCPELAAIQAAAEVLDAEGRFHGWWSDHTPKYADLDPIGRDEFEALVERMLIAAQAAKI